MLSEMEEKISFKQQMCIMSAVKENVFWLQEDCL